MQTAAPTTLTISEGLADFEIARTLFTEYRAEMNVDLCFQSFSSELTNLGTMYSRPGGCLLIARHGEQVAGCVALKPLGAGTCEMKRLYVRPGFRGRKIGLALVSKIIATARELGYARMRLDTLVSLKTAVTMYRRFKFREIAPYYTNPLDYVLYFEKIL
jgi:putative acetyltransferase